MQALKALVIGMGILIVLGMALLVYGLYQKSQDPEFTFFKTEETPREAPERLPVPKEEQPEAVPAPAEVRDDLVGRTFGEVRVSLPQGGRVIGITAEDDRLILRVAADDGRERLVIVDLTSGTELGRLLLEPQP